MRNKLVTLDQLQKEKSLKIIDSYFNTIIDKINRKEKMDDDSFIDFKSKFIFYDRKRNKKCQNKEITVKFQ